MMEEPIKIPTKQQLKEIYDKLAKNVPCNKNLLDNWYFGSPINRKGKTEYSDNGIGIDRWFIGSTAGSQAVVSVVNNFITITYLLKNLNSIQANFYQRIYNTKLDPGKYTLSFLYTSDCKVRPFVTADSSVLSGWKDFEASVDKTMASIVIDIPDTKVLRCYIQTNLTKDATVNLYAAKLELGDTQTLAHKENGVWVLNEIPNYSEQYNICRNYDRDTDEFIQWRFIGD